MRTLAGEQTLLTSGPLTITSARVRMQRSLPGLDTVDSIMLDQVSYCGTQTRSQPALIALGALLILGAFVFKNYGKPNTLLIVAGIVALVAYMLTRKSQFVVGSAGGKLSMMAQGMSDEKAVELVDAVESARMEFLGRR